MEQQAGEARRSRRSLLFVPGAELRKLERAATAAADTLLFDLEDSVAPPQKAEARANVAAALRSGRFGAAELAVRINPVGTAEFEPDLVSIIAAGVDAILLPKAERAADVVL